MFYENGAQRRAVFNAACEARDSGAWFTPLEFCHEVGTGDILIRVDDALAVSLIDRPKVRHWILP